MKHICTTVNIFTITSLSAFIFASTSTLLLVQIAISKPVQTKKQVNQPIPFNSRVRIYPANNSLPASRFITIENDNDFLGTLAPDTYHSISVDNPNKFFVFAVDSTDLPGFVPQKIKGEDEDSRGDD